MTIRKKRIFLISLGVVALGAIIFCLSIKEIVKASPQFFGYRSKDLFAVYTARLDGKDFKQIFCDPVRELTHARFSPDGKHITFTRYNRILPSGLAEENGSGYVNTEVLVCNADGSEIKSVIDTGPTVMNANSSWIDDHRLIFIHSPNIATTLPELKIYNLNTKEIERVATPKAVAASDPTSHGDQIVFAEVTLKEGPGNSDSLWRINIDGSDLKQITNPSQIQRQEKSDFKTGDYDPWLSPDGKTVAFMRHFGGTDWRIFSVDIDGNNEKQLTQTGVANGIPKWSNDGKQIVYVSWDNSKLENLGLYIMDSDGANKKKLPLPGGFLYTHPSYVPSAEPQGDGTVSSTDKADKAKIIFSARHVPALPGSTLQQ